MFPNEKATTEIAVAAFQIVLGLGAVITALIAANDLADQKKTNSLS